MKNYIKNHIFGIIYGILLLGFSTYALLDVFVIPHSYDTAIVSAESNGDASVALAAMNGGALQGGTEENDKNAEDNKQHGDGHKPPHERPDSVSGDHTGGKSPSDNKPEDKQKFSYGPALSSNIVDDSDFLEVGTYEDNNIRIVLNRYRYCNTYVFVADVYVSSPELLKTAFANDTYGRNITKNTTKISAEKGAILAVNGDYYGARESGYVIRNGVLYRNLANNKSQDLAIFSNGSFAVFNEKDVKAEDVLAASVNQVLSFGPGLVVDGEIAVGERQEVSHASYSNPRTAIGMVEPCHYIFVVSDGRTDESEGLSLYELATFMQTAGCKLAYNLDGGGSSTMVFKGELINNPCPGYGYIVERSVSDIVYIGY